MSLNILSAIKIPVYVLDTMARDVLGIATSGVSVGSYGTVIHLINESQVNQDKANAILLNYDNLLVSADKTVMNEGDADPVVTCSDASISGDSDVNYLVLLDGEVYASGSTTVSVGVATLNLVSPVAGVYEIFLYRTTGDYASGSVTITVSEV